MADDDRAVGWREDASSPPGTTICAAIQPVPDSARAIGVQPYACSLPLGHALSHAAVLDGQVLALWLREP